MNVSELLRETESHGVILKTDGGRVFFKPKDALPENVVDCIRKEKADIIMHLHNARYFLRVFSHVLGREITISWKRNNPKVIHVDRTPYTDEEISKLKQATPKVVKSAHLLKETFEGKIIDEG